MLREPEVVTVPAAQKAQGDRLLRAFVSTTECLVYEWDRANASGTGDPLRYRDRLEDLARQAKELGLA